MRNPKLPCLLVCAGLLAACGGSASSVETGSSDYTGEARVHFASGSWEPTWSGEVRGGSSLRVEYDFDRLPQCRNQSRLVSWVVEVSWRFDGGAIHTAALPGSPGTGEVLPDTGVAIPNGARRVELWFENRAVGGYDHCEAWDSRYGENYAHDVTP